MIAHVKNRPHASYTERRFPRSLREAFPDERFGAAFGPYRRRRRFADVGGILLAVALGAAAGVALFLGLSA